MTLDKTTQIEAAVFRQLIDHLDSNKDVQNIELMNLANFCRNCLAKWYASAADNEGISMSYDDARDIIYKMPFSEWKALYQKPATEEQLRIFNEKKNKH